MVIALVSMQIYDMMGSYIIMTEFNHGMADVIYLIESE